jgi:hypothetical protein
MRTITTLCLFTLLTAACSPAIRAEDYHSMLIPTYDPVATAFPLPAEIPTPAPLPTTAFDPPWSLPHSDDFSDSSSGWESGSWNHGSVEYTDGKYRVTSLGDAWFMWGEPYMKFSDTVMEVDAAQVSGPESNNTGYGFFCRRNETEETSTGYALLISGDGYYSIQKSTGGDYEFLLEWIQSDAILPPPAVNLLRAECGGNTLRLFANGELLAEVTDADYSTGDIALIAVSFEPEPVTVEFDNLKVSEP